MGKIVISENITLDGVVQDPTGEEGFKHGGWFLEVERQGPPRMGKDRVPRGARGRSSAAGSAKLRIFRSGVVVTTWRVGRPVAGLAQVRCVFDSALDGPDWTNATVIKGDAVERSRISSRGSTGRSSSTAAVSLSAP